MTDSGLVLTAIVLALMRSRPRQTAYASIARTIPEWSREHRSLYSYLHPVCPRGSRRLTCRARCKCRTSGCQRWLYCFSRTHSARYAQGFMESAAATSNVFNGRYSACYIRRINGDASSDHAGSRSRVPQPVRATLRRPCGARPRTHDLAVSRGAQG